MTNYFLKNYVKKRAIELNMSFPSNWESIMYEYKKIEKDIKKYILFTDYGYNPKTLNGGSMIPYVINLTKEWAVRIVLFNSEDTKNAFFITIGHELTHKDKEFSRLRFGKRNRQFIARVNEVHADFGAAQKMVNNNRQKLLDSIEYKRLLKKVDNEDFSHPSWARRKYYVENFDFNRELINKIAEDIGYTNQDLIDKVCNHYQEIKLN